ncbi:hypothetical protein JG687_00001256 [Phytophthora cactorum]|uniref:Myosin-binding domain-containing protein n=1 Tax=Phytophthora cactorum TaxID=29920 RepID=A0A8T1V1F9_9STRA|nr:hypothetical protein PC123_g6004 [Phytophthora cactorum]KAG6972812.1 hypothetical protein JG687_00001256 [Phytophthora cactorum]
MMEIAVTSSSPLGQYLAELEADGGESMAHLLSGPRPATSRKRPIRGTEREARAWGWMQLVQSLQRRVELVAVRRLLPELCVFHPTIREELQQALSDVVAFEMLSEARGGWWTRYIAVVGVLSGVQVAVEEVWRVCAGAGGTMVVVIVAVAAGCESGGVFVLHTMEWVVAIAVFVLLGMELSVRLLFAWYAHRSGRLVGSLNGFLVALETFNQTYTGSLTLVKRAELASRGYRLGAGLLPPIGRLEASSKESGSSDEGAAVSAAKSRLRCLPLRRKLRALNGQLQMRASAFVQEGEQTMNTRIQNPAGEDDILDEQAPSLLLTALAKQRNRAVLLLENAVNAALVRSMARACSSRDNKVGCSLIHMLGSHRVAVDQLIKALSVWIADLEAWNTTKDPVALLTSDSTKRQHQHQQLTPSGPDDPHLKSAATQLQDVRSMAETLTALAIAAQYELLSADSAAESLCSSRDAMRSMIEQLQEAWGNYDNALNALNGGENPQDTGADEEAEAEDCKSKPTEVVVPSSAVAPEDPNCTFVFTGTSTGDDSFDLLALLKQQEADTTAASSGPTPHFVRELRDVLAHRVAHRRPGLTKQVDHDPPMSSTSPVLKVPYAAKEILPPPPAAGGMFALPRAPPCGGPRRPPASAALPAATVSPTLSRDNRLSGAVATAFNLELEALLQRTQSSQQQNSIDCLGDTAEESEGILLVPEKSEVFC